MASDASLLSSSLSLVSESNHLASNIKKIRVGGGVGGGTSLEEKDLGRDLLRELLIESGFDICFFFEI